MRFDPEAVKVLVVDVDGKPVPGATVFATADPDSEAEGEVGEQTKPLTIAEGSTGTDRTVTLRVDPDDVPEAAFLNGAGLNITVVAIDEPNQQFGNWSLSIDRPEAGTSFWTESVGDTEAPTVSITVQDS